MSLKLGNITELADQLTAAAGQGGEPTEFGNWFDGRIVGVLASPEGQSSEYVAVGVSALPPGVAAPPHSHAAEEIAIVLSGTGQIVIDGDPIDVKTGDIVRTPADAPHTTVAGTDSPLCILWTYAPAGSEVRWLTAAEPQDAP